MEESIKSTTRSERNKAIRAELDSLLTQMRESSARVKETQRESKRLQAETEATLARIDDAMQRFFGEQRPTCESRH